MRILNLSVAMFAATLLSLSSTGCRRDPGPILTGSAALEEGVRRLQQGDIQASVSLLDRAADDLPNSASAHCNLGIAYWRLSKYGPAARSLKRASALIPQDPRPLEFLARVYMDNDEWSDARKVLTQALTISASSPQILTALGLAEMHAGDSGQARQRLGRALELKPGYPPALYNMALLYKKMKNPQEAEAYLRRYMETAEEGPYMEKAKGLMTALRASAGQQDRTHQPPGRTEPGPAPGPDSRRAAEVCSQGVKCYEAGDMDGAIEAYRRALTYDSKFINAAYGLGLAYAAKGKNDLARDSLNYTLQLKPDMVQAVYMLAVVERRLGQEDEAAGLLGRALAIDPNYANAHRVLGDICRNRGQVQDARRHLDRYVQLAPTDPAVPKIKDWLRRNPER